MSIITCMLSVTSSQPIREGSAGSASIVSTGAGGRLLAWYMRQAM